MEVNPTCPFSGREDTGQVGQVRVPKYASLELTTILHIPGTTPTRKTLVGSGAISFGTMRGV